MTVHSRITRHGSRTKRALGVQQILEWAFRIEKAQLELPEPPNPERGEGFGFGLEYVLLQRAALGCQIDGGRHKIGQLHPRGCRGRGRHRRRFARQRSAANAWRSALPNWPAPG